MLTFPQLLLIAIVTLALILIYTNRLRPDVAALLVLVVLTVAGLVTPQEALAGFSNPAILTLIGLFIISNGLEETGVANRLAIEIRRLGGRSEARLVFLFMTAGAILSLAMNNIAAAAVLLPVAVQVAHEARVAPSKLLIPLAFGTLVGGMATYFTTANIVISGVLVTNGQAALTMADFLPTGGLIAVVVIAATVLVGRRLLPSRASIGFNASASSIGESLAETYQLDERLWELRLLPESALAGGTLQSSGISAELGLTVMAIGRGSRILTNPKPSEALEAGDVLLVLGREDRVETLRGWGLASAEADGLKLAQRVRVDFTEAVLPPRSAMLDRTLQDIRFRDKYGLSCVAIWREGRSYRTDVGKFKLQVGDALLLTGPPARVDRLAHDPDFFLLNSAQLARPKHPGRMGVAVLITVLALLASIFSIVPGAIAMLAGAVAMVITGCLDMDDAYRSIEWKVLFLIAGFLPISTALINTGLASLAGDRLIQAFSPLGSLGIAAGAFLLAMFMTQLIGGQVAALLVGPIVVTAALHLGIDAQAIGVAAAIGCSAAFLTPMSHAVNVLVMGPGGYRSNDFPRIGLLALGLTTVCLMIGMALFWGLTGPV